MKLKILLAILSLLSLEFLHAEEQKRALIVGGSSGIGKGLALKLSQEGYIVGAVARRYDMLELLQKEAVGPIFIKQVDVTHDNAREEIAKIIDEMGGLDLCIINAAVWPESRSGNVLKWEEQFPIIDVNVKGFTAVTNLVAHYFLQQGFGHIMTISSVDALRGCSRVPTYSASKAFVSTYAEALRNYFDQNNIDIQVTDVLPGHVEVPERPLRGDESWVVPLEKAVEQIYQRGIVYKNKTIYVSKRWFIVALALMFAPDWLNNYVGGF